MSDQPTTPPASFPKFEFYEHNPRRAVRGKETVRFKVIQSADPDDFDLLWMSKRDLKANIEEFADLEVTQLREALKFYP